MDIMRLIDGDAGLSANHRYWCKGIQAYTAQKGIKEDSHPEILECTLKHMALLKIK
jgi:hypothetical protein